MLALAKGTLGEPGRIVIWDVVSGQFLRALSGHGDYVRGVAISPDGRMLASAGGDQTVRLWDLESGIPLGVLEGHRGPVFCVTFDRTGRLLASSSEDQTVRLWNVAERREVGTLRGHTSTIQSVVFSFDGTRAWPRVPAMARYWSGTSKPGEGFYDSSGIPCASTR